MWRIRLALAAITWVFLVACDYREFDSSDRYQSNFHYSYALNPGGRLEVDNFNGSVEIAGWDQPRCEIDGSKYANSAEMRDHIRIEVNQSGNLIYVHSVRPSGDYFGNRGVRYVIHVPRKIELSRIASSNGPIHVENTEGRADLKTSNGGIRVESLAGALKAVTSNGSITVQDVTGFMELHSSNSSIRAEHVMAGVEAGTSNGSITVQFDDKAPALSSPAKFESTNGRIDLSFPASPKSEIRAHTSNNGITVRLPSDASAKVRMETTNGHIRSDFEAEGAPADKHHRRQFLEETLGNGGPMIDLHTTNGSIQLLRN
jgi:hypothetical protein